MAGNSVLLLISDEPTHDLLECWLKDAGMAVRSVDEADDVAELTRSGGAAALVTDRIHRIGAANASVQELRDRLPGLRVVVVPVRSYLGDDMVRLARAVGAHAVLSEPMSRAGLARALA
jgi:DNA-binding NtrC family response regulator